MITPDCTLLEMQIVQFEQLRTDALYKAKERFYTYTKNEYLKYQHDITYQEERLLTPKTFQKICDIVQRISFNIVSPEQLCQIWDAYTHQHEKWIENDISIQKEVLEIIMRFTEFLAKEWNERQLFSLYETNLLECDYCGQTITFRLGSEINSIDMFYANQCKLATIRCFMELTAAGTMSVFSCQLTHYRKRSGQSGKKVSTKYSHCTFREAITHVLYYFEKGCGSVQTTA